MAKKESTKQESRNEGTAQGAAGNTNKTSQQASQDQAKMPPKDTRSVRPVQVQNRKRRLVPAKTLPVEGMREAAQLARSYIRAIETHNQGNQGRQLADLSTSAGIPFPYEHLLQFPGSMANSNSELLPQDLNLIKQLHGNGTVPGHLLNVNLGAMTANKRPFLANAAEESRMKRLRKIVNSAALEHLGHQAAIARYGGNHNNSPLLPSPPMTYFDSGYEDPSFQYLQKSPSAHYSSDPPSPTPRKMSMLSKLTPDMRLDSSAFPSADKHGATSEFYDVKDNQMKKPPHVSVSQQHRSAQGFTESHRNSLLQLPCNNLSFPHLDGIRHMTSLHPQTGTLTPSRFDNRSHMMPAFVNGEQNPQMFDGVYLGQIGQDIPIGLPQFSTPELAAYLGHLAALRNLPQHESTTHFYPGQHQEITNRPNSHPENPYAGILPLPVTPEMDGNRNHLDSGAYLPSDAGILPLPGRSEVTQMTSLQQGLNPAHGFNGSQHPFGQPVQLSSYPTQGDLASLQQELSGQRPMTTGHHPLLQSPGMQNHLHYLNQELAAQRFMGNHHPFLPPLAFPDDLATLPQELSAQQINNAAGHQRASLQGDLDVLQQEHSAQRLQNSLLHPSPLPHDLASIHELLSKRLDAGHHPLLQSVPMQGNLALLQQDLAARGLSGGHYPLLQSLPMQGDMSALQHELDFQRLNGAHPLVQPSIQQQLTAQNFYGSQHPLLQTLHM